MSRLNRDTAILHKRLISRNFNEFYIQNLKAATFDNDYAEPNKTMLTSDLIGNFVLINSPKLPFFVVSTPEDLFGLWIAAKIAKLYPGLRCILPSQ